MKEVEYTVKLGIRDATPSGDAALKKYYEPIAIRADIVLAKNQVSSPCGSKVGVNQKFKIRFTTNTDDNVIIQKTSGNPGYLDGYPLKIGF